MADKTQGEQIRELWINVATLTERVNNVREDIARVEAAHTRTVAALAELDKRVAVIDERLGELKKAVEEANRRRFALLPPLVGGLAGGIIALLGQLLFFALRP
jgi:septal ring factor EnvC (AmiA/AmiB activator)